MDNLILIYLLFNLVNLFKQMVIMVEHLNLHHFHQEIYK